MPPDLSFWLQLVVKMAMTAAIVVFISIVVERSRPFIGALIAALPTAAGAAYVILAIEHPPALSGLLRFARNDERHCYPFPFASRALSA